MDEISNKERFYHWMVFIVQNVHHRNNKAMDNALLKIKETNKKQTLCHKKNKKEEESLKK
jgi:hypothetical protein